MGDEEFRLYTKEALNTLEILGYIKLGAVLLLTSVSAWLAWNIRSWGEDARKERKAAQDERGLIQQLLTTIKGWTVIQISDRKSTKQEIKEVLAEGAEEVAKKVVEKAVLERVSDSVPDSGQLPAIKSPPKESS